MKDRNYYNKMNSLWNEP